MPNYYKILKGFRIILKRKLSKCCLCCCLNDNELNGVAVGPSETDISTIQVSSNYEINNNQSPPLYENVASVQSIENQQPPSYQNLEIDFQMKILNI